MASVDPNEMSFLDHLEDLRWHILRALMGIVFAGSIAFIFNVSLHSVTNCTINYYLSEQKKIMDYL